MPPTGDQPRVYEIRIRGCADTEEALGLQKPVERLLCPDPDHAPPCDIPWSFGLDEQPDGSGGTSKVLIVGVYTTLGQAARVAERARALVGEGRPVLVREGDAERFGELVEQYRAESRLRRD